MFNIFEFFILISAFLPFLVLFRFKKFIWFEVFTLIAVALHGTYLFGAEILFLFIISYIISTIAELVALKTRVNCFGVRYWYNLKHKFFSSRINLSGVYPLEVSFAWVLFKYAAFCLGVVIATAFSLPEIIEIILIPLILVSADFIIDPVAVNIDKLWKWERGTKYYGIPWQNFLGWYLVGLVSTLIFTLIDFSGSINFNYLFFLPIIFYAGVLRNIPILFKQNKQLAIIGALPAFIWVLLSSVSLIKLI